MSFLHLLQLLLVFLAQTCRAYSSHDDTPDPPLMSYDDSSSTVSSKKNFVSATLGSNMVLQRDKSAVLWGYSQPGATITTILRKGQDDPYPSLTTTVDASTGIWRQKLPSQSATKVPYTIQITSSSGESAVLENVLFGDVFLCGGQSNMQFTLHGTTNGTQEAKIGNNYPHIRIFSVGQDTNSPNEALMDLNTVLQSWAVANEISLLSQGGAYPDFGYFSSVCWFFGREVADRLGNKVPIGLISNNWGGTMVELWMAGGELYNAMIHPYFTGPMAITGFTWYQGEADAKNQTTAKLYAKNFPAMIQQWRRGFQAPDAYFGFIQLSTWCPPEPEGVAMLREAQMAALALPNVGYATNADHGSGCNVHPPPKQFCGRRLAKSAMALIYKDNESNCDLECNLWKSPSYSKAFAKVLRRRNGQTIHIVTVDLKDVSSKGLYLTDKPFNSLNRTFPCRNTPYLCAWASVRMKQAGWVNATISIQLPSQVILTAGDGVDFVSADDTVLETSYGWGSVPMMTLYDAATDLPVLPWKRVLRGEDRWKHFLHDTKERENAIGS